MHNALTDFSEDFSKATRPVLDPCDQAIADIEATGDAGLEGAVLPLLRRTREDVRALLKKVEGQDAYVLIFGPLKSGKSTLMNSLAGEYVSEVTSLPAYPCLVFVQDAERASYRIKRYDGSTQDVEDPHALSAIFGAAHGELAQALRSAEREGRDFTPEDDFPRAIQSVHVELPAGDLDDAHTVLVDTPGLYSRMKFGYASMTRDFRHAAAVAVFVVKADSIFLEQVFEEFTELLTFFSRVFLVLNVDSSKRDVGPDGEFTPSLEQTNPERLVRAFEDYSMNAPMKQAKEEGRLKIYPIDLLQTAAARLRGSAPQDLGGAAGTASFKQFHADLGDFLSSSDYVHAFVNDSLSRADVLLDRFGSVRVLPAVVRCGKRLEERRLDLARETARLDACQQLAARRWEDDLEGVSTHLEAPYRSQVKRVLEAHRAGIRHEVEDWYLSDDSFEDLSAGRLQPRFEKTSAALQTYALKSLSAGLEEDRSRLVPMDVETQLHHLGIDLLTLARQALRLVEEEQPPADGLPVALRPTDVNIKRSFLDVILFRSSTRVRRKLFGDDTRPTRPVPARQKAKRLGETAKELIREAVDDVTRGFVDQRAAAIRDNVHGGYVAALSKLLRDSLESLAAELSPRVEACRGEVDEYQGLLEGLDQLVSSAGETRRQLRDLRERSTGVPAPAIDSESLELEDSADDELTPFRNPGADEPLALEEDVVAILDDDVDETDSEDPVLEDRVSE
ncbi:MAG: dynamin family protein [Planctomycetota bacterium]